MVVLKKYKIMETTKYVRPTLRVVEFKIELGFAMSNSSPWGSDGLNHVLFNDHQVESLHQGSTFGDNFWD